MSDPSPINGTVRQTRTFVRDAASVAILIGLALAAVNWLTGGFKPDNQVQVGHLAEQVGDLKTSIDNLSGKVELLPRTADYAAMLGHLAHIDDVLTAFGNRLTGDEVSNAKTEQSLENLGAGTDTSVRQPQHSR